MRQADWAFQRVVFLTWLSNQAPVLLASTFSPAGSITNRAIVADNCRVWRDNGNSQQFAGEYGAIWLVRLRAPNQATNI